MNITVNISAGELMDKLSILELKKNKITDPEKLVNVHKEYDHLLKVAVETIGVVFEYRELYDINESLWDVEDAIRSKERNNQFDDKFIQLARSVYKINDKRAEVKKGINKKYNSDFVEEKSYEQY